MAGVKREGVSSTAALTATRPSRSSARTRRMLATARMRDVSGGAPCCMPLKLPANRTPCLLSAGAAELPLDLRFHLRPPLVGGERAQDFELLPQHGRHRLALCLEDLRLEPQHADAPLAPVHLR